MKNYPGQLNPFHPKVIDGTSDIYYPGVFLLVGKVSAVNIEKKEVFDRKV